MLKSHVNQNRKQSFRLKDINAIYKEADASYSNLQQQTSEDNNQCGPSQVFENPLSEDSEQYDKIGNKCTENCGDKDRTTNSDDIIVVDMTLKDIQTRCKGKKRKELKSIASSSSDIMIDHTFLKPEDEEYDLEEPLINLKPKLSHKSSAKRKCRRSSNYSESFLPDGKISAQTSSVLEAHCSSPIETDSVFIKNELSAANISVSIYKNMGVILLKDPHHADSSELIYDVKSEIMDSLCDVQSTENGIVSSTLVRNDSCSINSSAELLQNFSEGKSGNNDFCCFMSDIQNPVAIDHIDMAICSASPSSLTVMGATRQVDRPEPAYVVKTETSEVETFEFENTIDVSDSSTTNFIPKISCSENSSSELVEKVDGGEPRFEGSPYLTSESLPYCVDEVSSEMKEVDNYSCLSESIEGHTGEIKKETSKPSFLKLSPSLSGPKTFSLHADTFGLVPNIGHSSDASDVIENQTTVRYETIGNNETNGKTNLATINSQLVTLVNYVVESRMSDDLSNQVDEATSIKMQTCSLQNNVLIENSLLCREESDLKMISYPISEGGCLDNLILEVFSGDPLTKSKKNDNVSQAEESSSVGTYDVCLLNSHACFSSFYDLHGVDDSSSKNDVYSNTLEQMVNGYREKSTSLERDDNSSSADQLNETLDHSSQVFPPCQSAVSGLLNVEDSSKQLQPSVPEEKPQPTVGIPNNPSTGTPTYDGQSREKKFECDQGVEVELPPKKLLSNRKDLSPTSQEMLLQALNVNNSYDTGQAFDYGEAEVMRSSNRMMKRTREQSIMDASLLSGTKGILRSPDKSGTTCSCMKSTLIHSQAQKSITFSQRQMQDIEYITTRLLRELKSMKNIMEDTLSSHESPLAPPKYTCEEIKTATETASSLEASTRKWLSMMARDCNRFCKIMRPTKNKVALSPNGPRKQRKKITFADEAGGSLCHIKCFEQQSALFELPISED